MSTFDIGKNRQGHGPMKIAFVRATIRRAAHFPAWTTFVAIAAGLLLDWFQVLTALGFLLVAWGLCDFWLGVGYRLASVDFAYDMMREVECGDR